MIPVRNILGSLLFGRTVKGKWNNDCNLFFDPTTIAIEIRVDKECAEAFKQYFRSIVSHGFDQYTLRPEHVTQTNCVHAAVLIFVNFFVDYSENILMDRPLEAEKINEIIRLLTIDIAENAGTTQGRCINNLQIIQNKQKINYTALRLDLINYLNKEISRLRAKNNSDQNKINIAEAILENLNQQPVLDDRNILGFLSSINQFATHHSSDEGKIFNYSSESSKGWSVILKSYNISGLDQKISMAISPIKRIFLAVELVAKIIESPYAAYLSKAEMLCGTIIVGIGLGLAASMMLTGIGFFLATLPIITIGLGLLCAGITQAIMAQPLLPDAQESATSKLQA